MTGEFNSANPADDTVPIEDGGGGGGYYGGGYYGGGGGDYGGGYEPVGGYYGGHSAGHHSGTINASGDSYGLRTAMEPTPETTVRRMVMAWGRTPPVKP